MIRAVAWQRPEGEAKNTRLPFACETIQDVLRSTDLETESTAKRFERDTTRSGLQAYKLTGYRKFARNLKVCTRTAFSRLKRLRDLGLASFEPRFDARGNVEGMTMISTPWKSFLDDLKANPQIAKTPDGDIIVRNGTPMPIEEAAHCGIKFSTVVATTPARKRIPEMPAAPVDPGIGALSKVLERFGILDADDAGGAASLLATARESVPVIAAADLAAELDAELYERGKRKARKNQTLHINIPYVGTFIGHLARKWAAYHAERKRAEDLRALQATRAAKRQEMERERTLYDAFAAETMEKWLAALPPAEYAALIAEAAADFRRSLPGRTSAQIETLARGRVEHVHRGAAGVPSFDVWRRSRAGPNEPRAG
jgi:hypothetical protein